MKYAFLISIAMFAFAVSCGKKDKKQNVGKTAPSAQLDCKGKDAKEQKCVDKLEAERKAQEASNPSAALERQASGADKIVSQIETIPNLKDSEVMAIQLNKQTALVADVMVSAQNDNLVPIRMICPENIAASKDVSEANPEEKQAIVNIMLFDKSSIVADLKVTKGDPTKDTKLYMLTCNSKSDVKASQFGQKNADKVYAYRELSNNQHTMELITMGNKKDSGVLASFECGNDDSVIKSHVKKIGDKVANRIRLKNGSAVMVFRAVDQKIGDKELSTLGTEAQKEQKISVIICIN